MEIFTLDIFNPKNFMKAGVVEKLLQRQTDEPNAVGVVTLKQCADQEGKFKFSTASSVTSNPMVKNQAVTFDIKGLVSSPEYVGNIHLTVNWNGQPIYDADIQDNLSYTSNFDWKYQWFVPDYAPEGQYEIKWTGFDKDGKTTDLCVLGDFQL